MLKLTSLPAITLATPGTRQRISASSLAVTALIIQADPDNTGIMYVGDSSVSSSNGTRLEPGFGLSIDCNTDPRIGTDIDMFDIFVDGSSGGDKVYVSYTRRLNP